MVVRIDRDSIKVVATKDPNIVIVTADVTTDPDTIKEPILKPYSVKWNQNSGMDALVALFEEQALSATEDSSLENSIKSAIGVNLRSTSTESSSDEEKDYVIYANNVTINQV